MKLSLDQIEKINIMVIPIILIVTILLSFVTHFWSRISLWYLGKSVSYNFSAYELLGFINVKEVLSNLKRNYELEANQLKELNKIKLLRKLSFYFGFSFLIILVGFTLYSILT